MSDITFRLTENLDPEERLEEAALWKAMHDRFGSQIRPVTGDVAADFGRLRRKDTKPPMPYWTDPAFLREAHREFVTLPFDEAKVKVAELHKAGAGAFVKSTRDKHAIFRCPVGTTLTDEMSDFIYSFIDGGPALMVQELVKMTYEWRFFVMDRVVVTDSTNHPDLTPLDHPCRVAYRTPYTSDTNEIAWQTIRSELLRVAQRIASTMRTPTAVVDCAYINGVPGCVELNPLHLGSVGLFACDVRALANAATCPADTPA
jgi:hypothetical protein